ncbi:MAG: D-alanyl-D-alanine carboxypeptidase/D-alanyl-D-alanine-endopeptidase [Bacteroidetes bacterium]|jgi:D-alanyl-D-alanine carboxypeptidase/D-alanyl-D-alanine-endopeptidase (penicillin-binding protein 4)|nr:D-alanyl-D-alanine carboxypeptidase/D-alanyl-D-alanine-endopeptidase [Bacteroidota bacterium]
MPTFLTRAVSVASALALAVLLFASPERGAPSSDLEAAIDEIITDDEIAPALWGLYVQDPATGEVLLQHNADLPMLPASNQKLLTAAAALRALGPDYRFQTHLLHAGPRADSVLRGDLLLRGAGDPTFGSRAAVGPDPLHAWARQLAEDGITRIEGRLIGWDDVFADAPYAPGWDVSFLGREDWAAAAGGLSYRDNLVELKIDAATPGAPPTITADPPGYLAVRNTVQTSSRRRGRLPRVQRPLGSDSLTLYGTAPHTYRGTYTLPVHDPTAFTLHSFAHALREAGITVDATLRDADALDETPPIDDAEVLAVHQSPPLRALLPVINKKSDNFYAEQVFRAMGYGGTARAGARRLRAELDRLGVPLRGLAIYDGSGLSRKNYVTPRALGTLLAQMHQDSVFVRSLPQGGEDETTLEYRLVDVPVRAKTGSLQAVRTLSGYLARPDDTPVAFVILVNNYSGSSYRVMEAIDAVVGVLTGAAPPQ